MEDEQIIGLYFARCEQAIGETERKYGGYCRTIAGHILKDAGDVEECVSDTWLRAWGAMPPCRPERLGAFLGRITRNLVLDRLRADKGRRRIREELGECLSAGDSTEALVDRVVLTQALYRFLAGLPPKKRKLFLRRYWYFAMVESMSQNIGLSKTVGGITVDVDSAFFGDRGFQVLLRVRGRQFASNEGVCFDRWSMELEPDPTAGMGHGRGWEFAGIDGDGSLLLFARCYWDQAKRPDAPFTGRLSMSDLLLEGTGGVTEEVIQAGTWAFAFPLEITEVPESIALPDCTVVGTDPNTGEAVELELCNLVLYSTGIAFEKIGSGDFEVTVILEDGSSIAATLGIGDTRWWDVPVDLAQVTAVRIGETTIRVPQH